MGIARALCGHCAGTVRALHGGTVQTPRATRVRPIQARSQIHPIYSPAEALQEFLPRLLLACRPGALLLLHSAVDATVDGKNLACSGSASRMPCAPGACTGSYKDPRAPRPQCWYWLPAAFATCKIVSIRAGGGNCAVALAILSLGWGREGHTNLRTGATWINRMPDFLHQL